MTENWQREFDSSSKGGYGAGIGGVLGEQEFRRKEWEKQAREGPIGASGSGGKGKSASFEEILSGLIVLAIWIGISYYGIAKLSLDWWWPVGIGGAVAGVAGWLLKGPLRWVLKLMKWSIILGVVVYGIVQYREAKVDYAAVGGADIVGVMIADAMYDDFPQFKKVFGESASPLGAESVAPSDVIVCRVSFFYTGMQRPDAARDKGTKQHYINSALYAEKQFSDPKSGWRMQVDGPYRTKSGSFGFPVVVMTPRPSGGRPSVSFVSSVEEQICPHEYTEYARFPMPEIQPG